MRCWLLLSTTSTKNYTKITSWSSQYLHLHSGYPNERQLHKIHHDNARSVSLNNGALDHLLPQPDKVHKPIPLHPRADHSNRPLDLHHPLQRPLLLHRGLQAQPSQHLHLDALCRHFLHSVDVELGAHVGEDQLLK